MSDPLLELTDVKKHFVETDGVLDRVFGDPAAVHAVDGVSFAIEEGSTFGLVGESGCGKSTLGRTILGLHEPDAGSISFRGQSITDLSRAAQSDLARDIQVIFQDPFDSLNPRMTVGEIITEPLNVHDIGSEQDRRERVAELLDEVGLSPNDADKYPHQFSGGQQQRIAIARALSIKPQLIIADEPVSSLDMSEQSRVLNLLDRLQEEHGVSYLFIAHDLNVVKHICDRVGVMYLGHLAEVAPTEDLFANPRHPYTASLLSAIPPTDPTVEWDPVNLDESKIPDPVSPPEGCNFCTRCPVAEERCWTDDPSLEPQPNGGDSSHLAACYYPDRTQTELVSDD